MSPSSGQKLESAGYSKTLIKTYKTTPCHTSEYCNLNFYCRGNISYVFTMRNFTSLFFNTYYYDDEIKEGEKLKGGDH
jgi:hypothetical protein